jgi:hypothetical protein
MVLNKESPYSIELKPIIMGRMIISATRHMKIMEAVC